MATAPKTIAIIDDDDVFRRGLVRAFKDDEYSVIDFSSGGNLQAVFEKNKPDLILCDYRLPGPNGLEILNDLRNHGDMTPFLLMTGHFTSELEEEANELGAAATFEKPLSIKRLKDSCRRVLAAY